MAFSDGPDVAAPGPPSWRRSAAALARGLDLADACAAGGLGPLATARLVPRWAGAWVDLLDGLDGARVMVVDRSPGRAAATLADRAAVVGFAEDHPERAEFRRAWLGGRRADVVLGDEEQLTSGQREWDVVVLDGTLLCRPGAAGAHRARMRRLAATLAAGGRLVVIADNLLSPLRAVDRARGHPGGGPGVASLATVSRTLEKAALAVRQRFCLLRSTTLAVTSFELEAPEAAAAVLQAAAVPIGDGRGAAMRALRRLGAHRSVAYLVPGWLVVATPADDRWKPSPARPTGRLGYADSREMKVVRGEPPRALEKSYGAVAPADNEAMALQAIARSGLGLAPRLLGRPAPDRIHQTWIAGRPLSPSQLLPGELREWVLRAVRALVEIHGATAGPDGRVLVHGDFWLGNLLVDGLSVVGIIDWSGAHWGDRDEDLAKLVDHLAETGTLAPAAAATLAVAARREYAALVRQPAPRP